MAASPGRNDPCPCGSGKKYKHCCLNAQAGDDVARMRIRRAEGRIVDLMLTYLLEQWGKDFFHEAWREFFLWDDVPDDITGTQEFESMFLPWVTTLFVPEPEDVLRDDDEPVPSARTKPWPVEPVVLHWLNAERTQVSDDERAWIHAACRSPMSAFVAESVDPGRSIDLKDILTGRRFHVLEASASRTIQRNDVAFSRVVTMGETSVMFGMAPWRMGPEWHAPIIDFRESTRKGGLMTRDDLEDFGMEIRELYLDIADQILNPAPPRLSNTDGDPLVPTTLTFKVDGSVETVAQRLTPLGRITGDEPDDELFEDVERDDAGVMTSAVLSWKRAGNKKNTHWTNTILGTLRLKPGQLVVEVNSEKRAKNCAREIKKLLGPGAVLVSTEVVDLAEELAKRRRSPPEAGLDAVPKESDDPELLAVEEALFRQHMEAWVDTKVPALGNKTPRVVARTALGRERLAALISSFETGQVERLPNGHAILDELRATLGLLPG
jgi:hypothetical protein